MRDEGEGQGESTGFQIKDRRRFDEQGNIRSQDDSAKEQPAGRLDSKSTAPSSGQGAKLSSGKDSAVKDSATNEAGFTVKEKSDSAAAPEVDFSSFILSMAHSVLVHLGEVPAPAGVDIPVNLEAAKQTIDLLAMLKSKTSGNLETQEEHLIEEILHNLRVSFVQAKNRSKSTSAA
jgi:hypothetical protein